METKPIVRVLLVDDEAHVRLYIKTLLSAMGYDVVGEATNGNEALAAFDALKPDLVLMDINMPVMDGVATLKAIRAKSNDVAVVMLTSVGSADVVQHCLDAGANYHLRKDSPMDQLRREISETWKWLEQVKSKGGSL